MNLETNRILIAEDHYVSRHLLERNLANWGFNVSSAEDGEAAMSILASNDPPSIAIIDWMMPKLDGLEVCRRVRALKDRPYLYLLLLTAKSQKEEVAAGLEAGADDYVIKPFDPDELRARLKVGQRVVQLIPICSYCKSVRDDKDYWHQIEEYIHKETGSDFTHGICPTCLAQMEQELKHKD